MSNHYWRLVTELGFSGIEVTPVVKGSRSEAGRKAANIRWAGHIKADSQFTAEESRWNDMQSPDGGFTIDTTTGGQPITGFAVAIRGHSSITPATEFFSGPPGEEKGRKIMADWLKEKGGVFSDPDVHVGGWHDPKNKEIVLDPVKVIDSRADAITFGRATNQQKITDLAAVSRGDWDNAFIDTGGTGDR